MLKAFELIPLIHVLIHNYVKDEVTKDELLLLIADLIPRASREFLEYFELIDPKLMIGS